MEQEVVENVFDMLQAKFGKMKINYSDKYNFLGMDIKYLKDGNFEIGMESYLQDTIDKFGEEPLAASTPARSDLFIVNEDSPLVDESRRRLFYKLVYRLIYVTGRGRKDLELAISFLAERANVCNEGDYCKLRRLIHYIYYAINLKTIIGIDNITRMVTFIDASYAIHPNIRSHTGGAISYENGVFVSHSKKQKLNTKSSTESELVGVSDVIPKLLFISLFLEAQDYPLQENIVYQDNQSAMKLEINGRKSCSKRLRHIHIRYFCIKDLVDKELVEIKFYPTQKMIADFFTKPLQGSLFRYFRDFILGHRPISELELN